MVRLSRVSGATRGRFVSALLLIVGCAEFVESLAGGGGGGGGGGFGEVFKPIELSYAPDTSASTGTLVQFLKGWKSTGIVNEEGTEVGTSLATGRRGVFASRAFKKNEIVCKIPSDCALALSDPALGGGDSLGLPNLGYNYLHMYAHHPDQSQVWAPYLNTLPTQESHFDPTPDFFSDDEISQLEHPRAVKTAQNRKAELQQLAQSLNGEFSLQTLQFATWLVASRAYAISINDAGGEEIVDKKTGAVSTKTNTRSVRVLLPYIDLINHSSDQPNSKLDLIDPEKDEAWFAIRASRPIPRGREITIAYGSGVDSSVEILNNYGFVPDENKVDTFVVKKAEEKDGIATLEEWTTTLEEDLTAMETAQGNMKAVLALRVKLKRAYA